MANVTPSTSQLKSQLLHLDTLPVQPLTLQSDCRSGDLSPARRAVLQGLGRYLEIPYAALIHSAFGSSTDTLPIRQKLIEDAVLNVFSDSRVPQWAGFAATPARSNVSESAAFQPLGDIISSIFHQIPNCEVSFAASPFATPLSERGNTSRPDANVVLRAPAANATHWFDIVVPFEFKKAKDHSAKHDNEQKIIWSLHNIMREDPLRRFALGITIEDTNMRVWYSNRAFLVASEPISFMMGIDNVISLFCSIGSMNRERLGWDPNIKRVFDKEKIQYRFKIGNQFFTTTRPLVTYGADAMVGSGTRVYEAHDENGKIVAIKDSWRDKDRDPEGMILEKIFKDIQDKFGEKQAAEVTEYFVKVRAYEDVFTSGQPDETFNPMKGEDIHPKWIAIAEPILSRKRQLSSTGLVPDFPQTELARCRVRPLSPDIPCRVHTRTVYEEVGIPLMKITRLADNFACLSGALRTLYYLHKVGWVHRDFSVANVLWVGKEGQQIGKLTDLEYAKKVDSEASHDVRTGTMNYMAIEVECQRYLFLPPPDPATTSFLSQDSRPKPPFHMNFLHDVESSWWTAIWVLFRHTDTNSPAEDPKAQLGYFNQAFPGMIAQAPRQNFFAIFSEVHEAYKTLSATYRDRCARVILLGVTLKSYYEKAEKSFPHLSLDDNLLEDVHNQASDAYSETLEKLRGCNIDLRPLHEFLERDIDDPSAHQVGKKARRT